MKKILIFGMTESMGGIESFLMNYYRHFDRNQLQCDFLCNTQIVAYEEEIIRQGGKVYRIPARRDGARQYKKALKAFFTEHANEYDAIWENVCSLANIDYLIYAKKYGIPCRIIHSHSSRNMDSKLRGKLHSFNKIFLPLFATEFWACSESAAEWFYQKKIIREKIRYINNAVDTNQFIYSEEKRKSKRLELGINNKFVVGNVGRFHFEKNQLFLLDVFVAIAKKRDALLLLIGTGEEEEKILSKIKSLGIEDKVKILKNRRDIPELLQAMDVFVLPSLFEGVSVSAIEAQAAGLPVYLSLEGISEEVNVTRNAVRISLSDKPDVWAERILNDSKTFVRKDTSYNIKAAGYDIDVEAQKLQKLLERILS